MAQHTEEPVNEDERLLAGQDGDEPATSAETLDRPSKRSFNRKDVILCAMIFFFAELFELELFAPATAILERSICYNYYKQIDPAKIGLDGWVDATLCKELPVQEELATIKGWQSVFNCIPVFLVSAPLARFARKVGPSTVILISLVGLFLQTVWIFVICSYPDTFAPRLVWVSATFLLCGGGTMQIAAMVHLLASKFAGVEHTGNAFYLINVAYMFDELLAPMVASFAVDFSLTVAFLFALACLVASAIITLIVPKVPVESRTTRSNETGRSSSLSISSIMNSLRPMVGVMKTRAILLSLPIFFIGMFRMALISAMMQFPRVRFGWKFSQVTALFTVTGVLNLVIFLGIVPPFLRRLRSKYSTRETSIQLGLIRCSLMAVSVGCLLIGTTQSQILLCLGTALLSISQITRPPLLAFVTIIVPESAREDLYGLTQLVENVTSLVAGPILQNLLRIALRWPQGWWGLPFVFASGMYAIAVTFSWLLRAP